MNRWDWLGWFCSTAILTGALVAFQWWMTRG